MSTFPSLRPYQSRIVEQVVAALTPAGEDLHSALVESPTGSGKTLIGLAAADALVKAGVVKSVAWIAMRRTLLAQAIAERERWGFTFDLRPVSMFDNDPPACDLAIIDEAQHDAALSMANLYGKMGPKKLIGLSATPFRSDRFRLCFQKGIRDAGIHRLIADGYLSPYEHFTLPSWEPAAVAAAYLRERDRWGQSLIFFRTRVECEACLAALKAGGVAAEVVTASSDRERQIAEFEAGDLRVLVNMSVLGEGFDCPSLRTVFCRPAGKLPTVQMAGRVLRTCEGIAVKQVVQPAETAHPFVKTAAPKRQWLWQNGEWMGIETSDRVDAMVERMQQLVAACPSRLPDYLKKQGVAARTWTPRWTRER